MKTVKQKTLLAVVLGLIGVLIQNPVQVYSETSGDSVIPAVSLRLQAPICGTAVEENVPLASGPQVELTPEDMAAIVQPPVWISDYNQNDVTQVETFSGKMVGGQNYHAYVVLEAVSGFRFGEETVISASDKERGDELHTTVLYRNEDKMIAVLDITAVHNWDPEKTEIIKSTCSSEGREYRVCAADPGHTETVPLPIDSNADEWGEWITVKEADTRSDGMRMHICNLCGKEESDILPRITLPYTKAYEPKTSWPMAATVVWNSDETVIEAASSEVRPATAIVWLDSALKVYDRSGNLISDSIDSYVESTHEGFIPAFYVRDAETSSALKNWLEGSPLVDCFVVSDPEHKYLVKDVADLIYVRGMLDYSEYTDPDTSDLTEMVASVNGAHGKVIILSQDAADYETVRKLQSLAATVWVKSKSDLRSLLTMYTNGVDGIVVDDYNAAIRAEEFFQDDVPSLLRIPLIIGHRGDPSIYVENTLDSAKGAFAEGADSVENDIQLSADGQLFILHDQTTKRLLTFSETDEKGEVYPAEHYTLEELRSHPFIWDDILVHNEVNASVSRDGSFFGHKENKQYTVPTLEEYLQEFEGTGLIHDTEIKSYNPEILSVFKEMVDRYDAWDQVFCISFNWKILKAAYAGYPEIAMGMLNFGTTDLPVADFRGRHSFQEITEKDGAETALLALYGDLDQVNGTYNPLNSQYGVDMVRAGRHRGLTVWPWTYFGLEKIAQDYMAGVTGMTMNNAWIVSDQVKRIQAEDITVSSKEKAEKPVGVTRVGEEIILQNAELLEIERLSDTDYLMMWRCRIPMDLNGNNYGSYYMYSNPFILTVDAALAPIQKTGVNIASLLEGIVCLAFIAGIASLMIRLYEANHMPNTKA